MGKINTERVYMLRTHILEYGLLTEIQEWNIQILAIRLKG